MENFNRPPMICTFSHYHIFSDVRFNFLNGFLPRPGEIHFTRTPLIITLSNYHIGTLAHLHIRTAVRFNYLTDFFRARRNTFYPDTNDFQICELCLTQNI